MKISKIRILTIFMLFLVISLSLSPFALAKTRKTYLSDFLLDNLIEDKGFSNCDREDYREDNNEVSYEATAYALEILGKYNLLEEKDLFGKVEKRHNSSDLQDELEENLNSMYVSGIKDIYDTYYILKSLEEMDVDIDPILAFRIKSYLDAAAQSNGGFAATDTSTSATLISTYFALQIYDLIDQPLPDSRSFVLSCSKTDGGYGGDPNSPSTIANTYYAILIMDFLDDFGSLISESLTINYLNSFYVDDDNNEDNYGGYLPDHNAKYALISTTYYCLKAISILDEDEIEDEDASSEWILDRQNFQDGGFVDQSEGYEQKYSSVISSYFAHEALDLLGKKEQLEEKVFMLEWEWYDWLIFCIILIALIALAIIGIYIRRKRRL
ncbi:MAG: prenyltransferase/squalene oxidase repeat-containing protein [Candidatus Hermodarchaeota archaeon]